jgi:hypothetical protein
VFGPPEANRSLCHALGDLDPESYRGNVLTLGLSPSERAHLRKAQPELWSKRLGCAEAVEDRFESSFYLMNTASELEVPHLLLSLEPLHGAAEVTRFFEKQPFEFPLLLRCARGAPPRPTLLVQGFDDFEIEVPLWLEELDLHLGESMVLVQRLSDGARRFDIPFLRDSRGETRFLPWVETSLQLRGKPWIQIQGPEEEWGLTRAFCVRTQGRLVGLLQKTQFFGVGSFEVLVEGDQFWLSSAASGIGAGHTLSRVGVVDLLSALESSLPAVESVPAQAQSWSALIHWRAEDLFGSHPVDLHFGEWTQRSPGWVSYLPEGQHCLENWNHLHLGHWRVEAKDFDQLLESARTEVLATWMPRSFRTNTPELLELLSHPWVRQKMFHADFIQQDFVPALVPPAIRDFQKKASQCQSEGEPWGNGKGKVLAGEQTSSFDLGQRRSWNQVGHAEFASRQALTSGRGIVQSSQELRAELTAKIHRLNASPGESVRAHSPWVILNSLGRLIAQARSQVGILKSWKINPGQSVQMGESLAEIAAERESL